MRISDWSSDVCSSDLCIPMDGSLTQAQADAVGYAALRAASDIARHIDSGTRAEDGPYGWALLYVLHRTLTTFLYKAHLLDALVRRRSAGGVVVWTVGWPEASPVRGFSLMPRSEEHTSELQSLIRHS